MTSEMGELFNERKKALQEARARNREKSAQYLRERGNGYRDGLAAWTGQKRDGTGPDGRGGDQFFHPTIPQIRSIMAEHGLTGSRAAKLAYLSGGQAFRKYLGGASPHRMSGAVWFTLVAKTMLPPEMVAEIENKMLEVPK